MAKKIEVKSEISPFINVLYIITWAVMPLVYSIYKPMVQDAGLYPQFGFLAFATALGAGFLLTKATPKTVLSWPILAFTFFMIWHFAGYTEAFSKSEFWATTSRNATVFAYLILTYQLLQSKLLEFKSIIMGGLLFGAFCALSVLPDLLNVLFKGDFAQDIYKVKGLFVHKNFAASALLLALPFAYLGAVSQTKWIKNVGFATIVLILIEIALMRTRGVWLGFLGGMVVVFALQYLSRKKVNIKQAGYAMLGFISLIALMFLVGKSAGKILDSSNIKIRQVYWENSVDMAKEYPVTGVGAGNWKLNFAKYGLEGTNLSVVQGETLVIQPHNDMLWVLSELGIPALIAFVAFFALLVVLAFRLMKSEHETTRQRAAASLFGVVAFLVYGLGEFPMERPVVFGLLALFAAYILHACREEGIGFKVLITVPTKALAVVIILIAILSLYVDSARISGEKEAAKAVTAYLERKGPAMFQHATQAQSDLFELDIYISPMQFFQGLGLMEQSQFKEAERVLKDGLAIAPYHINTISQLADCYKFQKEFDKALKTYDEALAISPMFYRANLSKAEVYMRQNDVNNAMAAINAVSYKNTYPKYQQVGLSVLKAFIDQPSATKHADLYGILKPLSENPAEVWRQYNIWKSQKVAAGAGKR